MEENSPEAGNRIEEKRSVYKPIAECTVGKETARGCVLVQHRQ
jgi:hypothetical protein